MQLLVVGGAGYIGGVVAAELARHGHELTVCDDLSTGNAWAVPAEARFVPVDLTHPEALGRVVADGYDAVLHFGALSLAGASIRDPLEYLRVNVVGTVNLLDAMRRHGVRRLVYSSSAAVYGRPAAVPVPESSLTAPVSPYGAWARTAEEAVRFAAAAGHLDAVGLRYFNVAGASGALGEWHRPETHLIPLVLQVAAGVRPALPILGTDYGTADGTAIRDYVHVVDVARANLAALAATDRPGHAVYNIGTGTGTSVREVVALAREVTGRKICTVDAPRRHGDPPALVASIAGARRDLGWVPVRSAGESVADAWAWMLRRVKRASVERAASGLIG
jgi:UDP-glucose 4-epimerase